MTVYELIQELTQFDANADVNFKVRAKFDTDVIAEFDRDNENDEQEVLVMAEFNDYVDFNEIMPSTRYKQDGITIDLEY